MARPIKETVDYFPHFTGDSKTMYIIDNKYGNEGYAFWFKILEFLCNQKGLTYNAYSNTDLEYLAAKTRVSSETATNILDTLAELDAIDKELWTKYKVIWATNLLGNVKDAYKRRLNVLPQKPVINESISDENEFMHTETPENDIKPGLISTEIHERKERVNESKLNEIKLKGKDSERDSERDVSVPETLTDFQTLSLDPQAIELCNYYNSLKPGESITQHTTAIKILIDMYSFEWVKEALQRMVIQKNQYIQSYIEKILKNWVNEGKEMPDARAPDKQDNTGGKVNYDFSKYGG